MRRTIGVLALLVLVACGADARTAPLTDSVARVEIETCRPGPVGRATAVAVSTYGMLTVAHAFDGARSFQLLSTDGEPLTAELVHLEVELDVAVLRVTEPVTSPLRLGSPVEEGPAVVVSAGTATAARVDEVDVRRRARIRLDGGLVRHAIELDADIVPGDSGGPVVVEDELVAMVFASSLRRTSGWALDVTELRSALVSADASTPLDLVCP